MKIRIFNRATGTELITINDPSSEAYITGKIVGLGLPAVRMTTGSSSGRHGGYSGTPFYEPRLLTIDGILKDDSVAAVQARRRAFVSAFSSLADLEVHIEYPESGQSYLIYCKLYGTPDLDYIPLDPLKHPFGIDLLADDPIIYDNTAGAENTATIQKAVGGGIIWPTVWPRVSAPGAGPVTVTNSGDLPIYPVIRLTGSMTNPAITNQTTGQSLGFTGFTAPAGSVVVIDMYDRIVTLNGGNILGSVQTPPGWFALQPGDNTIRLSSGDSVDTVQAVMKWRDGFMGI